MKNRKILQTVLLSVFSVILLFSMIVSLYRIFTGQITNVIALLISIIAEGFALFYILWGYRKPHGDLLRYAMLIYAVSGIPFITNTNLSDFEKIVWVCIIFLVGYVSGRLHKFRQNVVLGIVILILNIVKVCYPIIINTSDILTVLEPEEPF